jgi:hypothetical protein
MMGLVLGTGRAGYAADERPLSAAQAALFESDHLAGFRYPSILDYLFRHDGRQPYADNVSLAIREVHPDGSKDVPVEFVSGDHRLDFAPVGGFHGNPLIVYFLEWDVLGMQQETGGSAFYFCNRIRAAFVDQADDR